jgi:hypothetical protein
VVVEHRNGGVRSGFVPGYGYYGVFLTESGHLNNPLVVSMEMSSL